VGEQCRGVLPIYRLAEIEAAMLEELEDAAGDQE
jgi:hypothetical protein